MSINLDEFMQRVHNAGPSPNVALKVLGEEFKQTCDALPADERETLIADFTERVRAHIRSISDMLTRLESDKAKS